MKRFLGSPALAGIVTLFVLLVGCSLRTDSGENSSAKNNRSEVYVLAASSLSSSMQQLVPLYEQSHPGIRLVVTYGSSGSLQKQIEQGAPADVFLSAASHEMESLTEKGLTESGKTTNLLSNSLVVAVPKAAEGQIRTLSDLQKPDVKKVALGQPASVPAGTYAKEALTNSGIWNQIQSKLVYTKDVRQVLTYIETGNVDAGFVYRSDALQSDKVAISTAIDPHTHSPIVYPVAVLNNARQREAANSFYQWLQSAEALSVFRNYGFETAGAK